MQKSVAHEEHEVAQLAPRTAHGAGKGQLVRFYRVPASTGCPQSEALAADASWRGIRVFGGLHAHGLA